MITLLKKLFIKSEKGSEGYRTALGYVCGGFGIFLNILLCISKFVAGTISHSIAITADAVNNLSDAGSSVVTLLGFKISGQKPDSEHPYGHGRMEYVAGFVVSILILMMSWSLISSSVKKIIHPEETVFSVVSVIILTISILVKCYMAIYNRMNGKEIGSVALMATAMDSLSDCISTGVVLAVTIASRFISFPLDGYAGIVVGLFVGYAGIKSAIETLNPLLGLPPEEEFVKGIEETALSFDENILGIHDMLIHDYGPGRKYVSLHAEVPAEGDILELHEIIDALEKKISDELSCFVTVHMDPIVTSDEEYLKIKEQLTEIINEFDSDKMGDHITPENQKAKSDFFKLSMHDFRMVPGESRTNLIFDVVVPMGCHYSDAQIKELLCNTVKEKIGQKYVCVIQVDHAIGTTKE